MAETLEEMLLAIPPQEWRTQQLVVLDWYDGPRTGFCRLACPEAEFYFSLLDERYNPHGLDDRLLAVHQLPPGLYEELLQVLSFLGGPEGQVWCPIWLHPDPARLEQGRSQVEALIGRTRPTGLVVLTRNGRDFLGCWRKSSNEPGMGNWFETLGIPPAPDSEEE